MPVSNFRMIVTTFKHDIWQHGSGPLPIIKATKTTATPQLKQKFKNDVVTLPHVLARKIMTL